MKTISKKVKMKMAFKSLIAFLLLFFCNACSVLYKTAKEELVDDFYTQKIGRNTHKVYVNVEDDTLYIHKAQKLNHRWQVDTSRKILTSFPKSLETDRNLSVFFSKKSFDIDFLTIPLKFRPLRFDVPAQLNTNLNGSLYLGYRLDSYMISYKSKPLKDWERHIHHFGFSVGFFNGIGNTFVSPTNTQNILQQEYDGIVWNKAVACIFALNRLTLGLAVGTDYLLDKNREFWIYQNKIWYGFAFGLNLN